ncbi:hypothetical protein PR048_024533 [Dryococelus australis]|uniref:Uncharacterized protein n=1 Tax=Dryococelus australis TaxID=614101 RepID=A0ABQ9GNU9_9NEOP|nr:hypothetical protein PR048_024533 [Dryococelus australis]
MVLWIASAAKEGFPIRQNDDLDSDRKLLIEMNSENSFEDNFSRPDMVFKIHKIEPKCGNKLVRYDGHTSSTTIQTSQFCNDNGIDLVAFYPNATYLLLHPLDVAVIPALKKHWKNEVHTSRLKHLDRLQLKKMIFSPTT